MEASRSVCSARVVSRSEATDVDEDGDRHLADLHEFVRGRQVVLQLVPRHELLVPGQSDELQLRRHRVLLGRASEWARRMSGRPIVLKGGSDQGETITPRKESRLASWSLECPSRTSRCARTRHASRPTRQSKRLVSTEKRQRSCALPPGGAGRLIRSRARPLIIVA